MKRIFAALLSLAMTVSLLAGCGTQPGGTGIDTGTAETPVVYFSNALEYSRLYSIRADGTGLTRVLDERVGNPVVSGGAVYYTGYGTGGYNSDLCRYDGKSTETLAKNIVGFQVSGDYIAYGTMDYPEYQHDLSPQLRLLHLKTGEDTPLAQMNSMSYAFSGDYLYYYVCHYSEASVERHLYAYALSTGETAEVVGFGEADYIDRLYSTADGLYFQVNDGNESRWFSVTNGSSQCSAITLDVPAAGDILYLGEDSALYQSWWLSEDEPSAIHFVSGGEDKSVLAASGDGYLSVAKINDSLWLVSSSSSVGWGGTDEYGYPNNYAYPESYCLLAADGTVTPLDVTGETGQLFAAGDFPRLDSSTARKPVTTALYNLFVMNYGYDGAEPLCSTTHNAWLNIADGVADLALLAAPTEEEQAYLDEKGVKVDMKLYGGDGLVFIGNKGSKVSSLTQAQLLGIYRGEITNWSEVGGEDHPISVYYRDDQSGSQRLFEKLAFKGQDIPDFEALGFQREDEMSTIVNTCLNDPYAIGYSIMTYLGDVYQEAELTVFAIDGVAPSVDTVKDQSYPYNTQGFVVIRSDEPADSPARRLYNWFGCPLSDDVLFSCSVTPLHG